MNLDIRDELFWFNAAMKKSLTRERSELYSRRLAQASDGEAVSQRLQQINFELQKLNLEDQEE